MARFELIGNSETLWLGRRWHRAKYYDFTTSGDCADWLLLDIGTHTIHENNEWGGLIAVNKDTKEILISYI